MFGNERNLKYVIYARKSTESEDRQVKSLGDQIEFAKELAKEHHLKIIKTFSESGSASKRDNRPKFKEMVKMIESGRADGIICWHQNRLARNPLESGLIHQLLIEEKIKIIITRERAFYPDDNALLFEVEAGMSAQYSRDLSKNVKRGMRTNNKQGRFNSLAPVGYLNSKDEETGRSCIIKDPARFELLQKAFRLYLTGGYSVPEIVSILNNDWGFRTKRRRRMGGKPLSIKTFYDLLRNPFYMGFVRDCEDPTQFNRGQWDAMITEDEYWRIQRLLMTTKTGTDRNLRARVAVDAKRFQLKGILKCGECGCAITANLHPKKLADGSQVVYVYYHCTHAKDRRLPKEERCKQVGGVREEELFRQIDKMLDNCTIHPKLYNWGLEIIESIQNKEIAERNHILDMQTISIEETEKQLDRLLDMSLTGRITNEQYDEKKKKLDKMLYDLKQAKRDVEDKTKNWYEVVGRTFELLKDPHQKFNKTTCDGERRQILQALGYNQVLRDKKIEVELYKWVKKLVDSSKNLEKNLKRVITDSDRIKNDSERAIFNVWSG